jgi:mannosyltransferase OCH1-like enzyme
MIPNIVHFNYGLMEQEEDFLFVYYIAVLSCKLINNPEKIYFHYHYEPKGQWWKKTKELVDLIKIDVPLSIGTKSIKKVAHKSDIARMQILKKYGGIYLDIDTISIRSYKDLLHNKFFIANEITESGKNKGLCNAIMGTEPEGSFITNWWNNYEEHFDPDGWQESSTILPFHLSKENTNLTILKPSNFLLPSCESIELIFEKPNNISEDLIVLHYWNQYSIKKYLQNIKNFDWVINNSHTLYGKALLNVFSKLPLLEKTYFTCNTLDEIIYDININDFNNLNNLEVKSKDIVKDLIKKNPNILISKQFKNDDIVIGLRTQSITLNINNNNQIVNLKINPIIGINDIKIIITHKYVDDTHIYLEIFRTDANWGWNKDLYLDVIINDKNYFYYVGKSLLNIKQIVIETNETLKLLQKYDQKIPKKIFQTWKTNNMDLEMENTTKIIKNLNPEYEYKLFTDDECIEYIKNNFSEHVLYAYNNLIPGAFKADLFRYCILYQEGGVYIDCKMIPLKPFREIIKPDDSCILVNNTFEANSVSIYNAFICSEPKNNLFLQSICQIVNNNIKLFYPTDPFAITGPTLLYNIHKKLNNQTRLLSHPNIGLTYIDHNNGIFDESNNLVIYKTYKNYYKQENGGNYISLFQFGNCYKSILNLLTVYSPVNIRKIKKKDFVLADILNYDNFTLINQNNEYIVDISSIDCSNGLLILACENNWIKIAELDLTKFAQIYICAKTFFNEQNVCIQNKIDMFKKINTTHKLIHAHGNNNFDTIEINNKKIPLQINLTYLRSNLCDFTLNKENLPSDLDVSININKLDHDLNFFPFLTQ